LPKILACDAISSSFKKFLLSNISIFGGDVSNIGVTNVGSDSAKYYFDELIRRADVDI